MDANDVPFLNAFPYVAYPSLRVGHVTAQLIRRIQERGPALRAGPRTHDGATRSDGDEASGPGRRRGRARGRVVRCRRLGLFRSSGEDGGARAGAGPADIADTLLAPAIGGSLDQTIENLQSRLRVLPTDWQAFASLGLAYVQQARVTADPSYYPKAQGVLRRSLGLERDDNFAAMVGMAALAAARHDFAGALRWGEQAKAINPYNGNVYGVIGDAQVELGRYGTRSRRSRRWSTPGPASPRTPASRTRAN